MMKALSLYLRCLTVQGDAARQQITANERPRDTDTFLETVFSLSQHSHIQHALHTHIHVSNQHKHKQWEHYTII